MRMISEREVDKGRKKKKEGRKEGRKLLLILEEGK